MERRCKQTEDAQRKAQEFVNKLKSFISPEQRKKIEADSRRLREARRINSDSLFRIIDI